MKFTCDACDLLIPCVLTIEGIDCDCPCICPFDLNTSVNWCEVSE